MAMADDVAEPTVLDAPDVTGIVMAAAKIGFVGGRAKAVANGFLEAGVLRLIVQFGRRHQVLALTEFGGGSVKHPWVLHFLANNADTWPAAPKVPLAITQYVKDCDIGILAGERFQAKPR